MEHCRERGPAGVGMQWSGKASEGRKGGKGVVSRGR